MEALNRLVSESLARHGFDVPIDPRRLQWSRWFRCESPHSLLVVPSKPGVFALAEEIADLGTASAPEEKRRMLAVLKFSEVDDMAFTLDRMFTLANPMRSRLVSGRCFLRFVVIQDQTQRRSICGALNQWVLCSAQKATGFASDFASSLELTPSTDGVAQILLSAADGASKSMSAELPVVKAVSQVASVAVATHLDSGAASNHHCPQPFPSGF